jgi:hypothetical protein
MARQYIVCAGGAISSFCVFAADWVPRRDYYCSHILLAGSPKNQSQLQMAPEHHKITTATARRENG